MNIWLQMSIALISVLIGIWLVRQIDNSNNSAWPRQSLGVRLGVIGLLIIIGLMLERDFGYLEVVGAVGLAMGVMFIAYRSDAPLDTFVRFILVIGISFSIFLMIYSLLINANSM